MYFRELIVHLFPEDRQPGFVERESDEHVAHAETLAAVYVKREQHFQQLDAHVRNLSQPMAVLGESGIGKSALLGNYFLEYRRRNPDDLAIIHFIGRTPESADEVSMLRRIMLQIKRHFDLSDDVPTAEDAVRDNFRQWLARAASGGRMLLVLDGLNQLETDESLPALGWLPADLPGNCRVILSTLPGRYDDAVGRHGWPKMKVEPLTRPERRKLLEEFLGVPQNSWTK